MGLKHYEQLQHYLHVSHVEFHDVYPANPFYSEPTIEDDARIDIDFLGDIWWHKLSLKPILSIFQA